MQSKILTTIIVALGLVVITQFIRTENIKDRYENTAVIDNAKEQIRQEKLLLLNEIYGLRQDKEVLLKVLSVYDSSFVLLESKDEELKLGLGFQVNKIKEMYSDELEKYFKDEFKNI